MTNTPDWTEIRVPGAEVFWIEEYYCAVDAILGAPVWVNSPTVGKYLERGIIKKITRERAQEINTRFANLGDWAATYLNDNLTARWGVISNQTSPPKEEAA